MELKIQLHILHLSDFLPDRRVEKTIHTDKRLGNKTSYIGLKITDSAGIPNTQVLNLTSKTALYNMSRFQRELKNLITEIDPDLIHGHDILMGRAAVGLGYPVVYNDHEYHSKKEWTNNPIATPWTKLFLRRKMSWIYRYITFRRWEKKLYKESVIITANEDVAAEHRKKGAKAFTIPNYPEKNEVKMVWKTARNINREYDGVYIGKDLARQSNPFLQAHQAYQILNPEFKLIIIGDDSVKSDERILSTGFIPHKMIYQYVMKAWTGLLPWNPHYFHQFCSPNKFYSYIHSGAVPIVPYTLKFPIFNLSLKFKSIKQIPSLIKEARERFDPIDVIEEAKDFLWEKYDDKLKQVNELALSKF